MRQNRETFLAALLGSFLGVVVATMVLGLIRWLLDQHEDEMVDLFDDLFPSRSSGVTFAGDSDGDPAADAVLTYTFSGQRQQEQPIETQNWGFVGDTSFELIRTISDQLDLDLIHLGIYDASETRTRKVTLVPNQEIANRVPVYRPEEEQVVIAQTGTMFIVETANFTAKGEVTKAREDLHLPGLYNDLSLKINVYVKESGRIQ